MTKRNSARLSATAVTTLSLAACGTVPPAVPADYIETPPLQRHAIEVQSRTQVLEVVLDPTYATLPRAEKDRIRNFVRAYSDRGHGPLTMLLPTGSSNPQLSLNAIVEARRIAFSQGVDYEEIDGGASVPDGEPARLYMSFKSYDAIAPECETFATIDVASARLNNELPNLGCSVRTNMAAMIADPADLLGQRPLGPSDTVRRQITFDLYRLGEQTASQRNEAESGTIADDAVQESN